MLQEGGGGLFQSNNANIYCCPCLIPLHSFKDSLFSSSSSSSFRPFSLTVIHFDVPSYRIVPSVYRYFSQPRFHRSSQRSLSIKTQRFSRRMMPFQPRTSMKGCHFIFYYTCQHLSLITWHISYLFESITYFKQRVVYI